MEKIKISTLVFVLFIITGLFACGDNSEGVSPSKEAFDTFKNQDSIKGLREKIFSGDSKAYTRMKIVYYESAHMKEFLYYAILMSDRRFPQAYFDVYFIMKSDSVTNRDSNRNKIADLYLLKAYELNVDNAKFEVRERFKGRAVPSLREYWEETGKRMLK